MPIKFRCQHCRQLLGISRSRANAVVDCPRCGRSLRVPGLDGKIQTLPDPGKSVRHDTYLMSALSELSALSEVSEHEGDAPGAEHSESVASGEHASSVVTLDPVTTSEPIDVEIPEPQPVIDPNNDKEKPVAIEESLEELAELSDAESAEVSEALLEEMRQTRSAAPSPVLLGAAAGLILLSGFLIGRMTAATSNTNAADVALNADDSSQDVADQDAAVGADSGDSSRIVRGRITYRDATGEQQPDAGALVLSLPTTAVGKVTWNARSLKRPADHPDRRAVIAALRTLGADVATADANGDYQVVLSAEADMTLIAVSRHRERPDDVDVPQPILKLLTDWFDSTSHICGRLCTKAVALDNATELVEIEFTAQ